MLKTVVVLLLATVVGGFIWYTNSANENSQYENQQYANTGRRYGAGSSNTARWDEEDDDYRRRRKRRSSNVNCAICLNLMDPEGRIELRPCKHIFHRLCIKEWLQRGSTEFQMNRKCPMCRAPYVIPI